MYLNCNYPVFNDFFIVKNETIIQYANNKQYFYGNLQIKNNKNKNLFFNLTSQCSIVHKIKTKETITSTNKLFKLFI